MKNEFKIVKEILKSGYWDDNKYDFVNIQKLYKLLSSHTQHPPTDTITHDFEIDMASVKLLLPKIVKICNIKIKTALPLPKKLNNILENYTIDQNIEMNSLDVGMNISQTRVDKVPLISIGKGIIEDRVEIYSTLHNNLKIEFDLNQVMIPVLATIYTHELAHTIQKFYKNEYINFANSIKDYKPQFHPLGIGDLSNLLIRQTIPHIDSRIQSTTYLTFYAIALEVFANSLELLGMEWGYEYIKKYPIAKIIKMYKQTQSNVKEDTINFLSESKLELEDADFLFSKLNSLNKEKIGGYDFNINLTETLKYNVFFELKALKKILSESNKRLNKKNINKEISFV